MIKKNFNRFLIVLTLLFVFTDKTLSAEVPTIAVIPFSNTSQNPSFDWLKIGIAETITTKLINIKEIKVVERLQTEKLLKELAFSNSGFAGDSESLKLGKLLTARYLVTGSFQLQNEDVLLQARLINTETGENINSAEITGKKDNILQLQKQLSEKLLMVIIPSKVFNTGNSGHTMNFKSYKYFNQAKLIVNDIPRYNLDPMRSKNKAKYLQAVDYLDMVLEESPDNYEVNLLMGILYLNLEEENKALAYFEQAIKLFPKDTEAYYYLGLHYKLQKDYNKSLQYFNKVLEISPDNAGACYGAAMSYHYQKNDLQSVNFLLKALENQPDFVEAELFMDSLLDEQKDYFESNILNPAARLAVNLQLAKNNQIDIDAFSGSIKNYPNLYKIYYFIGLSHKNNNNIKEAIRNFSKAIELYPAYPEANLQLADIYFTNNDCKNARELYQNYLDFSTESHDHGEIKKRFEACH